jgi:hypothetical protein
MEMDKAARLRHLVESASRQAGGDESLARRLGVSLDTLKAWADGRAEPPPSALAKLIAMVFDPFRPDPP